MDSSLLHYTLIAGAAFGAGAMNSVAGGGSFLSFPALLAVGIPPVMANASNSVALWPGSLAGAWALRADLHHFRRTLRPLTLAAFCGGIAGGLLLLATANAAFSRMIPWLLLLATLLFAASPLLSKALARWRTPAGDDAQRIGPGGLLCQFVVAIYGAFFGAGMGILMLAVLAIQGGDDMNQINALKNWLSAVIYSVAVLTFVIAGAVSWPHTLVMLCTGTAGGYAGARLARRIPAPWLRRFIVSVGTLLTLYYFFKTP